MRLRPFEVGLLVAFAVLGAVALLLLRTYSPDPKSNESSFSGYVDVWGTLPYESFDRVRLEIQNTVPEFNQVSYRYIPPENFDEVFINALADQKSPDLILVSHERIVQHRNRIQLYPYDAFSQRDYRNLFLDGAEIFMLPQGIFGFPIAVDPLVMYYNRDILSSNGFITPPRTWEEIVGEIVPRLTMRDFNRTIQRSAIAMGEYSNVRNAFGIMSALAFQGGSAGVVLQDGLYRVRLDESSFTGAESNTRPFSNAVSFYTNFNSIQNTLYSWNRSLPLDRDMFLREDLAIYFGYGSEGQELAARNPNLNFDIAELPQSSTANVRRTYGRFYALAMPQQSPNKPAAGQVLRQFLNPQYADQYAKLNNMSSVHRTSVMLGSDDLYGRVYFNVAPSARAWLNPNLPLVDSVFTRMLDDISANRSRPADAAADAMVRISSVY
jgi:ABC-type glycerol-3-phosphate transport system substrate-binding protein